ncbi:hypothetical protein [Mycobacterium sp. RTGN5]|uniref:hypothetical protein n=1 Tax=Mycobacterium sp. RTGN5 TaxID=3016522 RepID=UPI0029C7B757|nr:hypothetical protein [Mycobacterium sp. RTGN5]
MRKFRWTTSGGAAGVAYVVVAIVAATLNGKPPAWDATNKAIQSFLIDHRDSVVAQGWLYALASSLILWFAVVVRHVLYTASNGKRSGDLFLASIAVVAALSFVSMSIRIVTAAAADQLSASAVRTVGYDFSLALLSLQGFIVAAAAVAYAACVISEPVLPTWTAWLAILAAIINVAGTASVFFRTGVFSIEGNLLTSWLPVLITAIWYLAVSVALIRTRDGAGPAVGSG